MKQLHRWRNGSSARLECYRSWARAPVGLNQTIKLVFAASPLSTQHKGERARLVSSESG